MAELRKRVFARLEAGDKVKDIAERFNVHRNTVNNIKKMYKSGSFVKCPSTGRPRSVRTEALVEDVKVQVSTNPRSSITKLAKDNHTSMTTMHHLIKDNLGMKSRAVVRVQMLTPQQCQKRAEQGKKIVCSLKNNRRKVIVFSDEKNFHVDAYINYRNTRHLAKKPEDVDKAIRYAPQSKHPGKAMMIGVVCNDGHKLPPIWINGNLTGAKYHHILGHQIFPALNRHYGPGNWVWMQDGAPSHTSKMTQKYLVNTLGSSGFWSKDL